MLMDLDFRKVLFSGHDIRLTAIVHKAILAAPDLLRACNSSAPPSIPRDCP